MHACLKVLMVSLFLFCSTFYADALFGQDEVSAAIKSGPREDASPPAMWGATCFDNNENLHYWFGGTGGVSKTGPLLTYVFKGGKWVELKFENENKGLFDEVSVLENKWRLFYGAIANRFYKAELEEEKKNDLNQLCAEYVKDLEVVISKNKKDSLALRLAALKNDMLSIQEQIKNELTAKLVGESRGVYRKLVLSRYSLDVQPSPRGYANMAYDAKTKKIILFGGEGVLGVYSDTWLFDTATQKWEQVYPDIAPAPRIGSGMIAQNGIVYLVGGFNARGSLSYCTGLWNRLPIDVWRYDISKNQWIVIQKPEGKLRPTLMQPVYLASIEGDKLLYSGDVLSYGKKVGEVTGEVLFSDVDVGSSELGVASDFVQVRDSGFDPAWYEDVPVPDEKVFQDTLANLPKNTWINVQPPVKHVNRDWGTTVIDLKRDQLLHWAGGHSSHSGTDVAHYSLSLNRWHIAYTPELPFETVYSNDGARVPSLSGRPWSSHTYLSYALDSVTGSLFWAGKHSSYSLTNPSMSFQYDPKTYEWQNGDLTFDSDKFDVERHKTCMVPTPHGIVCWGDKRGGTGGESGLWLADLVTKKYEIIAGTDKKDKTTFPVTAYGDRHGITYDSKRDRVLLFHFGIKEKANIWACDMKTKAVEVLQPKGSEAFPQNANMGREATYIPDFDLVYVPSSGGKEQMDLIYDCAKNEWLEMEGPCVKNEKGKYSVGYGVSTGVDWDPKRKLLWLVQSNGSVYAMRIDLATAKIKPLAAPVE